MLLSLPLEPMLARAAATAAGPATVSQCTMYRNIRPVQCEHSPLSLPFFFYCTFEFGVLSLNGF